METTKRKYKVSYTPPVGDEWVEHPMYENYYANKKGEIYSAKGNGRILKQGTNGYGYLSIAISNNGEAYSVYVHRFVAACFIAGYNPWLEVRHTNRNRKDNTVDNLYLKSINGTHPKKPA